MQRKILLVLLTMSPLLLQADSKADTALEKEIANAKAQMQVLSAKIKTLESKRSAQVIEKKDPFVTHTELGFISTSGNTKTRTYSLDTKIKKSFNKHEFALSFDGEFADDDGVESKNKYLIELEYDYKLTKRLYLNYLLGYKSDRFSSFDYQAYTGPGVKYKVLDSKKYKLSLEGNILYSMDEYAQVNYADAAKTSVITYPNAHNTPVVATDASYSNDYAAYRGKIVYDWQMLQNLKFGQEVSYRGSFEQANQFFVYSKTGFLSKLTEMLSAGLSYKVDYVNQAGDKKSTDTTLTANLVIDY